MRGYPSSLLGGAEQRDQDLRNVGMYFQSLNYGPLRLGHVKPRFGSPEQRDQHLQDIVARNNTEGEGGVHTHKHLLSTPAVPQELYEEASQEKGSSYTWEEESPWVPYLGASQAQDSSYTEEKEPPWFPHYPREDFGSADHIVDR